MLVRSLMVGLCGLAALTTTVAAQDAANGEEVFKVCRACHQVGEPAKNGQGPHLNGLFGRKSGSVDGFAYSEANKASGITWDEANFATYIANPRAAMPGNKMAYAGLKDEGDIKDLMAFLKQFDSAGKKK